MLLVHTWAGHVHTVLHVPAPVARADVAPPSGHQHEHSSFPTNGTEADLHADPSAVASWQPDFEAEHAGSTLVLLFLVNQGLLFCDVSRCADLYRVLRVRCLA